MAWHSSFTQFLANKLEHTTATFWNSIFQEALDNDNYLKTAIETEASARSEADTLRLLKTDVVNTTTQLAADGKALNASQANPSLDGSMAKQISTNTQQINVLSTKYDFLTFPYATGFQDISTVEKSVLRKIGVNDIELLINVCKTDGTAFSSIVTFANLPVGYRPSSAIFVCGRSYDGGATNGICTCYILADGTVAFLNTTTTSKRLQLIVRYSIGG